MTNSKRAGRREWLGLAVLALPCLLYSMDLTVLNLALPSVSRDLAPSATETLWIVDIYGFLVAGFLITMGNLGDRIGRRKLLLLGAAAFGVASVLAALANSPGMLIAARALLGIAGATLAPSTLSLIRNMFEDPRERTFAIGVWTTSFSVGGAIGPVLGGVLLQYFDWGSVFLLGVPVMLMLLVLGPWLLPEYRDPGARPLDWPSVVLSLAAVLALVYGTKSWVHAGFSGEPVLFIAGGVAMAALFLRRQRRLVEPLVDLHLFRERMFSVSLVTFTLTAALVFGSYVAVAQYLQLVLNLSPFEAGLWTLPGSVAVIAGCLTAPLMVRYLPVGRVMTGGLLTSALGFALLSQVEQWGIWAIVSGCVLGYFGIGPVFTLGTDVIVGAAPPERAGAAAALSETSSELGGALGIALLGSLGLATYRTNFSTLTLPGVPDGVRALAGDTLSQAQLAAKSLPDAAATELLDGAQRAFNAAFELTAVACLALAASMAVAIAIASRRWAAPVHPTTSEEPTASIAGAPMN